MTPALLAIILQGVATYGPGAVAAVIKIFSSPSAPSQADWDSLIASTQITARDQMLQTLARHGILATSPEGIALLALVPA